MTTITFWVKIKGEENLVKKTYRGGEGFTHKKALERLNEDMKGKEYEIKGTEIRWVEKPIPISELKKD